MVAGMQSHETASSGIVLSISAARVSWPASPLYLRISHRVRNRFMFCHTGLSADPWKRERVHVNPAIFIHGLARPERIAEKRELDIGVIPGPIDILAIHDPCLARMQFEPAGLEPGHATTVGVSCFARLKASERRWI